MHITFDSSNANVFPFIHFDQVLVQLGDILDRGENVTNLFSTFMQVLL